MTSEDSIVVRIHHCRDTVHMGRMGLCASGCRTFFRTHNLDWGDFLANGITVRQLRAKGDALAEKVIATAVAEAANGA